MGFLLKYVNKSIKNGKVKHWYYIDAVQLRCWRCSAFVLKMKGCLYFRARISLSSESCVVLSLYLIVQSFWISRCEVGVVFVNVVGLHTVSTCQPG